MPRSYSVCFSFPFWVLILLPECCISSPAGFWFLTLEQSGALESRCLPRRGARMWIGSEVCSHLGPGDATETDLGKLCLAQIAGVLLAASENMGKKTPPLSGNWHIPGAQLKFW